MINYEIILKKNLKNVLIDILHLIKENSEDYQLYITFSTTHKNIKIPNWLKKKYPDNMTIVLENEFYDLFVFDKYFSVTLSFNNIKAEIEVDYDSIISFADPKSNFGLILNNIKKEKDEKIKKVDNEKNNIIDFSNYQKS